MTNVSRFSYFVSLAKNLRLLQSGRKISAKSVADLWWAFDFIIDGCTTCRFAVDFSLVDLFGSFCTACYATNP